jgi:probable rRNA maturation factor
VQVEVSVQDCYFTDSETAATDAEAEIEKSANLISTETWESWFQQWLETLQPDISPAKAYELSIRFTDDTEIQSLNAQYRNKNKPTDVLAFAALEVDSPQLPPQIQLSLPVYLGDIVISVDTANLQAREQGHSLETELAWLAAHGLLHLLGWDHPDEDSLTEMLTQQTTLLQIVNLSVQF